MGFLAILKLFGFLLWPAVFFLPYFIADKENFKKRLKQILKNPT